MTQQTEALRLADELERDKWHVPAVVMQAAADELRRLYALLEAEQALHQRFTYPELQRLRAQRDALLEALLMVKEEATEMRGDDFNLKPKQWAKVHAAIKAGEGTK